MGTYPLNKIDKVLGIIPRKAFDHLDLDLVQEDFCDQRDAVVGGESIDIADQLLPDRVFAAHKKRSR